jgi:hypothetical protein
MAAMCAHNPPCPAADAKDARRACVVCRHDEQGWCLLCNGLIAFDDGGAILPNGSALAPRSEVLATLTC